MFKAHFSAESAAPVLFSASPELAIRMRVDVSESALGLGSVQSILVRVQVRVEPAQRTYCQDEALALRDVFGERARWDDTQRSFLLANITTVVPGFEKTGRFDLAVPCAIDLGVRETKYFRALKSGHVPLLLLFSGTIFHGDPVSAAPISWKEEASFDLPVDVWQKTIDHYHPGVFPVFAQRSLVERLEKFRAARKLATIDDALETLLDAHGEGYLS